MLFIKKNYEKVLLGLVLFGLVVAVGFMVVLVSGEKQRLRDYRTSIISREPKELPPPDLSHVDEMLKRTQTAYAVDFSTGNKLFNPVRWMRGPNGMFRSEKGTELDKLEIVKTTPLHLTISLKTVSTMESGSRYAIGVQQEAAARVRTERTHYASVGEKIPVGDVRDALVLKEVKGAPENPEALIFELNNSSEPIVVSKDKPFRRVEGYTADLRFPPENRSFMNRRAEDPTVYGRIFVGGEEYNIVAIPNPNEVVLSAKSNKKKYTIRSAAP